ncbi:exported hypothetical protein [Candidatus Zixiibacteriota bacterium]|nr:exported hypothetical protein [candidate division Zixibacteria bacterium]
MLSSIRIFISVIFILGILAHSLSFAASKRNWELMLEYSPLYDIDTTTTPPTIGVIVEANGDYHDLENVGAEILSIKGHRINCKVPIDSLEILAGLSAVKCYSFNSKIELDLDMSAVAIGAPEVCNQSGYTGKSVIVGIVDGGIDAHHPDFQRGQNNTRFLYIWDQMDTRGSHPSNYYYGSEYSKSDIDGGQYINGGSYWTDAYGHGSVVTGIACGGGRVGGNGIEAGKYTGIAKDADIIFVRMLPLYANIEDAVEYIIEKAESLKRPCVINLSLGYKGGPRDGTSPFERFMDKLLTDYHERSVVIVNSCGNTRFDANNAEVAFNPQLWGKNRDHIRFYDDETMVVNVGSGLYNQDYVSIEIWYHANSETRISVTAPLMDSLGNSTPFWIGSYESGNGNGWPGEGWDMPGIGFVKIHNEDWDANHPDPYPYTYDQVATVEIADHDYDLSPGDWFISMSDVNGPWDAYITYQDHGLNLYSFLENDANSYEVNEPGNSSYIITVGSINTKNNWYDCLGMSVPGPAPYDKFDALGFPINQISFFSSLGPTRDVRTKPEIYAPGAWVASTCPDSLLYAYSSTGMRYSLADDCRHILMRGTSMSAPHVTGVVALMLEKNGFLSLNEIRNALFSTELANGMVNAPGAIAAIPPACIPGDVNGDRTINIIDVNGLISFLYKGGASPSPYAICSGDADCNCRLNIQDVSTIINFLYKSGPSLGDQNTWVRNCGNPPQ